MDEDLRNVPLRWYRLVETPQDVPENEGENDGNMNALSVGTEH